jgi:hypothetical protein
MKAARLPAIVFKTNSSFLLKSYNIHFQTVIRKLKIVLDGQ